MPPRPRMRPVLLPVGLQAAVDMVDTALVSMGALAGGREIAFAALPGRAPIAALTGGFVGSLAGALAMLILLRGLGWRRRRPERGRAEIAHGIRNKVTSIGLALESSLTMSQTQGMRSELHQLMRQDLDRLSILAEQLDATAPVAPRSAPSVSRDGAPRSDDADQS